VLAPLTDDDPRVIGPFRLGGRLGAGGMGTVYLGFGADDQPVAVKVPSATLAGDARFRARFRREAGAVQLISSGSVAAVVAADTEADPPWLATEFIQGATLLDAVSSRGPLAARLVVGFAAGLADGLVAMHANGVVHRDLKPANVVLAWDGPKIIDFGVALTTRTLLGVDSGADADVTLARTQDGQRLGTFVWMAPEQLRGDPVGPPADVFAWGACLTYATTGHGPFRADGAFEIIARIQRDEPDLDDVPAELVDLVRATLAKDPDARPSATELVSQLVHQTVRTPDESDRAVETALVTWVAQPPTPSPLAAPVAGSAEVAAPAAKPSPAAGGTPAAAGTPPARTGPLPVRTGPLPARTGPLPAKAGQAAKAAPPAGTLPLPAAGADSWPRQLSRSGPRDDRGLGSDAARRSGPSSSGSDLYGHPSEDQPTLLRSPLQPPAGGHAAGRPAEAGQRDDAFADAAGWRGGPRPPVVVTDGGRPSRTVRVVLALVTALVVAGAVTVALVLANAHGGGGAGVEVSQTGAVETSAPGSAAPSTAASVPGTPEPAAPPASPAGGRPTRGAPAATAASRTPAPPPTQHPSATPTQPTPSATEKPTPSVSPSATHASSSPDPPPTSGGSSPTTVASSPAA